MEEVIDCGTKFKASSPNVLEFFAGIGLARLGLEAAGFSVAWSNDIDPLKHQMYENNFGTDSAYQLGDICQVKGGVTAPPAALAWASSPCTDLSLAGLRAGLAGSQSGTFWEFTRILTELGPDRPEVVVLENVIGLATSHGGADLAAAIKRFNELGYSVDALTINARHFLPQSRPRLFLIGAQNPPEDVLVVQPQLRPDWLSWIYFDPSLRTHRALIPDLPTGLVEGLSDVVEEIPVTDSRWWDADRTANFLQSLSPLQSQRLDQLQNLPTTTYRTAYRRTRKGKAVWEVRADGISGCLRTARGGSSKQAIVRAGQGKVQVRWMTPLEYARLMGAGDYNLSNLRANQVFSGFGDAVAVPVVKWLAENYLLPLLQGKLAAEPDRKAEKKHG